jgi:hypothetical protein
MSTSVRMSRNSRSDTSPFHGGVPVEGMILRAIPFLEQKVAFEQSLHHRLEESVEDFAFDDGSSLVADNASLGYRPN